MRKIISKNKTAIKLLSIFFALLIATGCGNVLDEVEDLSNYPVKVLSTIFKLYRHTWPVVTI